MSQIAFQPAPDDPQLTRAAIATYFGDACKPLARHRVGVEAELFLIAPDSLAMATYPQIVAVLQQLHRNAGWAPVCEGEHWIGLVRNDEAVSLEPGGQLEYASAPYATLTDLYAAIDRFHAELLAALAPTRLRALSVGLHPTARVADIPIIPKARYGVMSPALEARGTLARHMMRATCGWQAAFDYADEADMTRKMRAALSVTSLVSAMYATSCWEESVANGFACKRIDIWLHTDPARCGLIPSVFSGHFGFDAYIDYAMQVPILFIVREDRWIALPGLTFAEFLQRGYASHHATFADWQLHLTTLFPEVRLKNYLEIRGLDANRWTLLPSVPALYAGLLASATHQEAAFDLTRRLSYSERQDLHTAVARDGLFATSGRMPVAELCREVIAIARDGLKISPHADGKPSASLDLLAEQIARTAPRPPAGTPLSSSDMTPYLL